ncbi:MAG: hypothetical protein GY761_15300 [Hyphomicrobiales bacterium]|nr:hypothetical protein [Hyphomicrobiales bacterium]
MTNVATPVRAGLVKRARDWQWSSIDAHLGADDGLTNTRPAKDRVGDFAKYLNSSFDEEDFGALRASEQTGRPVGSVGFIEDLETRYDRVLKPQKRGPKGRG